MDKAAAARMETRLQDERARAQQSLDRLDEAATIGTDEDGSLTRYPLHPADEGTDTMQQETAMSLLSADADRLTLIDDALQRLASDPDTFGKCENCGREIPEERLDLVPWTRHCMQCEGGGAA